MQEHEHFLSEKQTIGINESGIFIRRIDTKTIVTFNKNVWDSLWLWEENIEAFFEDQTKRVQCWLPDKFQIEGSVSSSGIKFIDFRQYNRDTSKYSRYYKTWFSTSNGFSFKKSTWKTLKQLKTSLDQVLRTKITTEKLFKNLILREVIENMYGITNGCFNQDCNAKLAHASTCPTNNAMDFHERLEKNVAGGVQLLNMNSIITNFQTKHDKSEEALEQLFVDITKDITDLKYEIMYDI